MLGSPATADFQIELGYFVIIEVSLAKFQFVYGKDGLWTL